MGDLAVLIYIIAGVLSIVWTVILVKAALAVVDIHKLLKDVIESGAIPQAKLWMAKKKAEDIIKQGYAENKKEAADVLTSLRAMKDNSSKELADLLDKVVKA